MRGGDCSAGRCASRPGSIVDEQVVGTDDRPGVRRHTQVIWGPRRTDPRYVPRDHRVKPVRSRPTMGYDHHFNPAPSHPAPGNPGATRRNRETTCGHRLNRPAGVVSVPGSTSVAMATCLPGRKPCFRRSAMVFGAVEDPSSTLHTLWMTVWTAARHRVAPVSAPARISLSAGFDKRETL